MARWDKRKRRPHLSSCIVNDLTSLLHTALKHTVGRRVCNHECSEVVTVFVGFGAQVLQVEESSSVNLDRNDLHSSHDGGLGRQCE